MAQYFRGEAYWLCGKYYQRKGKRLHRTVWEYHNGPIPKGHHVHHRDGDRSNNAIENLELLPASIHLSRHTSSPEHVEYAKWHMATRLQPKAAEWHGSEEGRKWHSEQGKRNGALPPRFEVTCSECGKTELHKRRKRKYCSGRCEQRAFRRRNPGYYSKRKQGAGLESPCSGGE